LSLLTCWQQQGMPEPKRGNSNWIASCEVLLLLANEKAFVSQANVRVESIAQASFGIAELSFTSVIRNNAVLLPRQQYPSGF